MRSPADKYGSHRVMAFGICGPTILAIVAFALTLVCILAGTGPQQQGLEKYHILSLNTSYFGHDIVSDLISDGDSENNGGDDGDNSDDNGDDGDDGDSGFPIDFPDWKSKRSGPYSSFAAHDSAAEDAEGDKVFNFEKRSANNNRQLHNRRGLGDTLEDTWHDIENEGSDLKDEALDTLNDIANDVMDKLSAELGISQWYSIHMLNWCEGNFLPNASVAANSSSPVTYNISSCSVKNGGAVRFQLNKILQEEISSGPLVQDLGMDAAEVTDALIPDFLQDAVDMLNSALQAILAFYCIAAACAGLSVLTQLATILLELYEGEHYQKGVDRWWVSLTNLVLTSLGCFSLGLASAIATAVAMKGAAKINDKAEDLGIVANAGMPFITVTWIAFGFMFVVAIVWQVMYFWRRKLNNKSSGTGNEKPGSINS